MEVISLTIRGAASFRSLDPTLHVQVALLTSGFERNFNTFSFSIFEIRNLTKTVARPTIYLELNFNKQYYGRLFKLSPSVNFDKVT